MNCGATVIFIISSYTKYKAIPLHRCFLNFSMYQTNQEVWSVHRLLGPTPEFWPKNPHFSQSPCDASAAGLGVPLRPANVASSLEGWFLRALGLWVRDLCIRHCFSHHVWARTSVQCSPVQFTCSAMSNSLPTHGLQHARLPCPSPTPRPCSKSYSSS